MLRIDCKSAKYVIEKDIENIASKHIFARWQAILSVFYFDIDKTPDSNNQIVKVEPASPINTVNCFTTLGTIPKPNYSSILASTYDPYAPKVYNTK